MDPIHPESCKRSRQQDSHRHTSCLWPWYIFRFSLTSNLSRKHRDMCRCTEWPGKKIRMVDLCSQRIETSQILCMFDRTRQDQLREEMIYLTWSICYVSLSILTTIVVVHWPFVIGNSSLIPRINACWIIKTPLYKFRYCHSIVRIKASKNGAILGQVVVFGPT